MAIWRSVQARSGWRRISPGWYTAPSRETQDFWIYVIQLERTVGEWVFVALEGFWCVASAWALGQELRRPRAAGE